MEFATVVGRAVSAARGPLRGALIYEHGMMREGIRRMLLPDVVVVDEGDCREVIARLPTSPCQVIMLDVDCPCGRSMICIRSLKDLFPDLPVLVLGRPRHEDEIVEALQAGADGYLLRTASRDEVIHALLDLEAGLPYLCPGITGALLSALRNRKRVVPPQVVLTARELEILHLMASGHTVQQMGTSLFLAANTIKSHTRSLYRKLRVSDRTSAVLAGMRLGLISEAASA